MSQYELEYEVARNLADEYKRDGFNVFIEPSASVLPAFLKGVRPDLVALKENQNVLVEITRGDPRSLRRYSRLKERLSGRDDWTFRLVVLRNTKAEPALEKMSAERIEFALSQFEELADRDFQLPALFLGWTIFEAIARSIDPIDFSKPQSPKRLVQQLATLGLIEDKEVKFLSELIVKRNSFAHGSYNVFTNRRELKQFREILEKLYKFTSVTL